MLQNISVSNKYFSEISIHQRILKMYYFHKNIEQQQKNKTVSTLIRRTIINHWEQMAVYNLSAKSYNNDFLKIMWHLRLE